MSDRPEILNLFIQSFSYKKGVPENTTEHGGGFVFDCRWITNPGKFDQYKLLTGADKEVQNFLEIESEMPAFLNQIESLLKNVIIKYQERKLNYLAIYFGCTGGQHRSVYAAIKIKEFIENNFKNIQIQFSHREQPQL